MDEVTTITDDCYNKFEEFFSNKITKINQLKTTELRSILDTTKKKIIEAFVNKVSTLKSKTRKKTPEEQFIYDEYHKIDKPNKEKYNFNNLSGNRKFRTLMKHLIDTNKIDITNEDFEILENLEDLSNMDIPKKIEPLKKNKEHIIEHKDSDVEQEPKYYSDSDNEQSTLLEQPSIIETNISNTNNSKNKSDQVEKKKKKKKKKTKIPEPITSSDSE
jgi:hypothetical protein